MSVRFHIPDFYQNYPLNQILLVLMDTYPTYFRPDISIASVYGVFPPACWNGWRVEGAGCTPATMREVLHGFNARHISLRFTFDNPLVTSQHLSDEHCNRCLRLANNGENGVIVTSSALEAYLREHYPHVPLTSSEKKHILAFDALCTELSQEYRYVSLDYRWNNHLEELRQLPAKEKCELTLNPYCDPACTRCREHDLAVARTQFAYCNHLNTAPEKPFQDTEVLRCPQMRKLLYHVTELPTHISPDALYEVYAPMGFTDFRIAAPTASLFNLMEAYLYYMVKPEHRDELRLIYLLSLEDNHVLQIPQ